MSNVLPTIIKPLLTGILIGGVLSVIPWEFALLLACVLLVLCYFRWRRGAGPDARRACVVGVLAGLTVVIVAVLLPVKNLDRIVGPMHYGTMTMDELTRSLARDWRVFASPDYSASTNIVVAFSTSEPLTRREVLQKLARETGSEIRIGYCGTGATFLFGAHPSFTRLRMAQQNGPANGSQPIRSETNGTSSAAGSRR